MFEGITIDNKIETNYEVVLLSNLFYKPSLMEEYVLPVEVFESSTYKHLLQIFKEQYEKYKTIDFQTIFVECDLNASEKDAMFEIASGTDVDVRNFKVYQEAIFKKYKNKLLFSSIEKFKQNKITQEALIERIKKIEEMNIESDVNQITAEEIIELVTSDNKRIRTRFPRLTKALNFKEHDMLVISARPGVGKSGFMLNLVESISTKYPCLVFNMEMSETSLYRRLISIISKIPMSELNKTENFERVKKVAEDISKRKIKVITRGQTIQSIKRQIIEECKKGHVVVFIDYAGLIGSNEKHKSLYELVTSNVKELRNISMTFDCTIVLLAQINRNGDGENPKLSDLKESGELEQSATQVILLSGKEAQNNDIYQDIKLDIAKNRDGIKGFIMYQYRKDIQDFEEYVGGNK